MAELYLVRHGQASFGAENYDQLSPSGRTQSRWLGEYFAQSNVQFDRVVIGTMRRHAQTADEILTEMNGPQAKVVQDADLNEYDFRALLSVLGESGFAPELSAASSTKHFYKALKQALQLWSEERLPGRLPETWHQFQARVERARLAIQRMGGKRIPVVSSGGPIAVFAQQILQAPAATAITLNLQIRNSSVSQYVFNDSAMSLVSFNSLPHLEHGERRELITYG
ncbi:MULTISPECIES: histidine phosphatase family protein [Burkholderiaceae]|uniref:histidine phosphatase family protein n=1 Tax=Burkholderiaceae TaxID=119060 RepID=UPI00141F41A1|nr:MULTISPECIES: histidine phosphatase family protein [Burkholderiaceae]NIF51224.1 histidine phosphatase family protein [Burkholderia sp. Ax-1724]NIF76049.1 histidine phosphatase family protein [Paraburkholderia sp. Cy-641]